MKARISESLRRFGRLRGPEAADHEWLHFCVWDGERFALANLAILGGSRPRPEVRLTVLLRDAAEQVGESVAADWAHVEHAPGRLHCRLPFAELDHRDAGLELSFALPGERGRGELRFAPRWPMGPPATTRLGPARDFSWAVAPACVVTGTVELRGVRAHFDGAPGYHDHNWGRFEWGLGLGWTWAAASGIGPSGPLAVVFSQVGSSVDHAARDSNLIVWTGGPVPRVFNRTELRTRSRGRLRPRALLRLPRVAQLALPGRDVGAPRTMSVRAEGARDRLVLRAAAHDVAQLVLPDEARRDHFVVIDEVTCRIALRGTLNGQPLRSALPGILEQARSA